MFKVNGGFGSLSHPEDLVVAFSMSYYLIFLFSSFIDAAFGG